MQIEACNGSYRCGKTVPKSGLELPCNMRPPAYPYLGTVIMGMDWPPKSALCVIVMETKMVQNSGWSNIMWGREGTVSREV